MDKLLRLAFSGMLLVCVFGCASKSKFTSTTGDLDVRVAKTEISGNAPLEGRISRTTFGRYPVKLEKDGYEPMYFNLPLKVSPGVILLDALFFAPAAFFNVQGSAPYYDFDIIDRTIRYKTRESGEWVEYHPTEEQIVAAKDFFGD